MHYEPYMHIQVDINLRHIFLRVGWVNKMIF